MNDDRISEVYKGEIWSNPVQERARRRIHWMCSQARGDDVLDIGCSQGIASIILAREGFQVTGIDIQPDRIEYALADLAQEAPDTQSRLTFMVGTAVKLPFEKETFDAILLGEVLEHLTVPERVLEEARRVLKPGGAIAITTPFGLSPHHDHKQTFGPSRVWELVSRSFTITSFDIVERYFRIVATKQPLTDDRSEDHRFDSVGSKLDEALLEVDSDLLGAMQDARVLRDELAALRSQVDEARRTNQKLNTQVTSLSKELGDIRSSQDAVHSQASRLQTELSVAQRNTKLGASRAESLKARVTNLERDRAVLREQLAKERWRRQSLTARKWWRIGQALAGVRRRPWRILVAPFDVVSIIFGRSNLPPRPTSKPPITAGRLQPGKLPDDTVTIDGPASLIHDGRRLLAPPAHPTMSDLRVAAISDEMTKASFAPECRWITFRPDNWEIVAGTHEPHLLLVESAWRGNDGSWEYRVGTYSHPESIGLPDLKRLVAWANEKGVPTVFWNKEDPVHFGKFEEAASLFDVICTSDADCIEAYGSLPNLAAKKIIALPFAAQPLIHNPIRLDEPRAREACFAGTYYGNRHDHRRIQMEMLLDGALGTGLRIYDRMADSANSDFAYPDRFSSNVIGAVPYADMVRVYKRYRVFLNTNSVSNSPTMFSRRVFELLACGTPVVSTPSVGMQETFGELVAVVESEAEVRSAIEKLLTDDDHWNRVSAAGIRKVMSEHCYAHRLMAVCQAAGIDIDPRYTDDVAILVPNADDIEAVADMASSQTVQPKEILVAVHNDGGHSDELGRLSVRLPEIEVRPFPMGDSYGGDPIRLLAAATKSRLSLPYSAAGVYAETVIEDLIASTRFAPGALVGAALSHEDEHTFVARVDPTVVAMPTDQLSKLGWSSDSVGQGSLAEWSKVGVPFYALRRDSDGSISL